MRPSKESFISKFFRMESSGGITLMLAAALAVVLANTPLYKFYALFLDIPIEVRIGGLHIAKPLLLWINDGLMSVFFFLIGLELKREVMEGELSEKKNIILPGLGAVGGMAVPALVYVMFNANDPVAMKGWAIPAATDIAFALGILSLLGSRVPVSIKIFLTSLAIFDDIGAILIIAIFYTAEINMTALIISLCCIPVLAVMNYKNLTAQSLYIVVGLVMWTAMLKSGVHATLAGVVLAMFIPLTSAEDPDFSPLKSMEHDLHFAVAFFILPVFAFANAGVRLAGMGADQIFHPVPIGIALGLFAGKQVGIFGICWMAVRTGLASLPKGMSMGSLYGASALCGVGFTMSLFIGSLAFDLTGTNKLYDERLGIILGSLAAGFAGYLVLKRSLPNAENPAENQKQ
ncbi:MAG: Na+/H+ antiporter NhaA [Desulfobacterales bacterium]|nr:Na+/H+ antiporter NhaA [Desulfobacterales bacterium]